MSATRRPRVRPCSAVLVAAWLVALLAPAIGVASAAEHDTEHYHIVTVGERADAEAEMFGRMLEQGYEVYKAHFGVEPRLGRDEKLQVFFADTLAGFQEEMASKGLPRIDSGGYYSPGDKVAYLWRQPQEYDTRCLVLHECAHQFHFLACCNNRNAGCGWYVEGIAEYLSNHLWDGETLVAPVNPWVTPKDNTAKALAAFESGQVSLQQLLEDKAGGYAEWWAFYRYLKLAEDGKVWKRFVRIVQQIDRGGWSLQLFTRTLGPVDKLQEKFIEWLKGDQQPMQQVWCFWQHITETGIVVHSPNVGLCPLKDAAAQFRCTVQPPAEGNWKAGVLLSFTDVKNFLIAFVDSGANKLRVHRYVNGSWKIDQTLDLAPRPTSAPVTIEARRLPDAPGVVPPGSVVVRVNGHDVVTLTVPSPSRMGLMADGCTLHFTDVEWSATLGDADDPADEKDQKNGRGRR